MIMLRFFCFSILISSFSFLQSQHFLIPPFESSFEEVLEKYSHYPKVNVLKSDPDKILKLAYHESVANYKFTEGKLINIHLTNTYKKRNHARKAGIGAIDYFTYFNCELLYMGQNQKQDMFFYVFSSDQKLYRLMYIKRGKKNYELTLNCIFLPNSYSNDDIYNNMIDLPIETIRAKN